MSTILLVAWIRLGLWVMPLKKLRRICERLAARKCRPGEFGVREIVWAIRLASRYVPQATCLTQALTAQVLLSRFGYAGHVHLGVALDGDTGFRAHAWVEHEGKVLIGGSNDLDSFTPMLLLNTEARHDANGGAQRPKHI